MCTPLSVVHRGSFVFHVPLHPTVAQSYECNDIVLIRSTNISAAVTNSFMASRIPGHPFWMECILDMAKCHTPSFLGRHIVVMNTTGPLMLSRVYFRSRERYAIETRRDLVVPCDVCHLSDGGCIVPRDNSPSYMLLPVEGGSWTSWDTKLMNFVFCHWVQLSIATAVIISAAALVAWYSRRVRSLGSMHRRQSPQGTRSSPQGTRSSRPG